MNKPQQFRGICPMCYKPILNGEQVRTLESNDRTENYHAACVQNWLDERKAEGHSIEAATSLFEQYSHVFVGSNRARIEAWVNSQADEWWAIGETMKQMRENAGKSLKEAAEQLGVSIGRLKRFEAGQPIKDAKLIYNAYILLLTVVESEKLADKYLEMSKAYSTLYDMYEELRGHYTTLYNMHFSSQESTEEEKEQGCGAE